VEQLPTPTHGIRGIQLAEPLATRTEVSPSPMSRRALASCLNMLFNSLQFLIFFPMVTGLYFLLPHRYRWMLLLFASCMFYMAFIPIYILILLITIVIDYFAGVWIENSVGRRRDWLLMMSILSTCLVLFVFKYLYFFTSNYNALAAFFHLNYSVSVLKIILPIGLSFHTFQSLSYVIEVHRGNQKAERHFGIYALYVMFYPQLVAGPIERPQNLLHQFYEPHEFEYQRVTDGLKLMAWGLFKKMLIADRVAILVNEVYKNPSSYEGVPLIVATAFFAIQIYCDFSGYSDIALGAAHVMGFKLMTNFRQPYFSKSVAEFWRRWHISLSTWFKDYLYIPLGGSQVSPARRYLNLFITFLVSGLWHGANWTFVVWGALHCLFITISGLTAELRKHLRDFVQLGRFPRLHGALQVGVTCALVSFAWIFFRADTMSDAWYISTHLFSGFGKFRDWHDVALQFRGLGLHPEDLVLSLVVALLILIYDLFDSRMIVWTRLRLTPVWFRWSFYYALVFLLLFYSDTGDAKNFIYFQF
jgi:D-alanyl-lipoteichoic acid acyltransferase DltB (MBOAT superfamily)